MIRSSLRFLLLLMAIAWTNSAALASWKGPGDYVLFNYFQAPFGLNSSETRVRRFLIEGPFSNAATCVAEMRRLNGLLASARSARGFSCERLKATAGVIDSAAARALVLQHAER